MLSVLTTAEDQTCDKFCWKVNIHYNKLPLDETKIKTCCLWILHNRFYSYIQHNLLMLLYSWERIIHKTRLHV